jgi:hypothetical protein
MAIRGRTLNILPNPTLADELDEFDKQVPANIELVNGVRTLAGRSPEAG